MGIFIAVPKLLRSTPSPDRLIQGGNHLLYETQMLSNTAALLDDPAQWGREWGWEHHTLYMAVLESFLVHARNLMDFFCPPEGYETGSRRQTDTFASDFCADWTPARWEGFKDDWKGISEEILHMTYLRPEVGRSWPYADLLRKLNAMLSRFLDAEDRLPAHLNIQLRSVVEGKRMSAAYTPAVEDGAWPIDPALLSGLTSTGSVPTTSLIEPWLITETPR